MSIQELSLIVPYGNHKSITLVLKAPSAQLIYNRETPIIINSVHYILDIRFEKTDGLWHEISSRPIVRTFSNGNRMNWNDHMPTAQALQTAQEIIHYVIEQLPGINLDPAKRFNLLAKCEELQTKLDATRATAADLQSQLDKITAELEEKNCRFA